MGQDPKPKIGSIVWRDLTVGDAAKIRDFYCDVTGWEYSSQDMGGYSDFNMNLPGGQETVAGICHARGSNASLPAQWLIYIVVEDVDESAQRCVKLGGKVYDTRTTAQDGGMGIWVSAGARYWDNAVDYTVTTRPILPGQETSVVTGKEAQRWWDPVIGVYMNFPVTPRVGFLVRATGGGFGIGNASDYMWDAEFAALFRLTDRLLLSAGYRQFKYRREDDGVTQTVTVIGPAVGLSIGIL